VRVFAFCLSSRRESAGGRLPGGGEAVARELTPSSVDKVLHGQALASPVLETSSPSGDFVSGEIGR
jgi:hypothetical protein